MTTKTKKLVCSVCKKEMSPISSCTSRKFIIITYACIKCDTTSTVKKERKNA